MPSSQEPLHDPNADLTDRLLHALASPIRRRILRALMVAPGSASTLSRELGLPLGTVAYHLTTVLYETCRVVKIVAKNQRRGAQEKIYALEPSPYIGIKWPEVPPQLRSSIYGVALSTFMVSVIASLEAEATQPRQHNIFRFQPIAADQQGRQEIVAAVETLQSTLKSVAKRCAGQEPTDLLRLVVGTAAFESPAEAAGGNA